MKRRAALPMIYQAESTECALACLAMVAGYHGLEISMLALRKRHAVSIKGATLRDVTEMARRIDLSCRPVRCEVNGLKNLARPALLHWDFEHFVVLKEVRGNRFVVHDPALGILRLNFDEVSNHFTGIAVEVSPTHQFKQERVGGRLTLAAILNSVSGTGKYVSHILWLTLFLEVFALLNPLFLKTIVDTGLRNEDLGFIGAVSMLFLFVVVGNGSILILRDYILTNFGAHFNLQMMRNLMEHLFRLPLSFFQKRLTGDLIDRYQSTNQIRNVITGDLPAIMLDGLVALVSVIAIVIISPIIGLIALAGFLAYLLVRAGLFHHVRTLTEKAIKSRSEENAHIIESLRAMQPIKIFGKEGDRLNHWANLNVTMVNAERRVGLVNSIQSTARLAINGLDFGASIYVGALLVSSGQMSLGLLFALVAYKAHFSQRSRALAERIFDLRLISVHLDRIADIACSVPEQAEGERRSVPPSSERAPLLEFRDVTFRYGPLEGDVLTNVSFRIDQGDFVALVGPSGSGKTTLFKLILGLVAPNSGQILYNGVAIDTLDMRGYRQEFGAVMQSDQLLAGTLLDNIAFFEASPDELRVRRCSQKALIHDDIDAMPMKYNSRIGDLGSALSGGQKQRVLLARALYHDPNVLLMDEGTANLDHEIEVRLLDNLVAERVTCVAIAHRPETIKRATRKLLVSRGSLTELDVGMKTMLKEGHLLEEVIQ